MVNWKIYNEGSQKWTQHLNSLPYFSLYQSYEWGEVKKSDGWDVIRLIGYAKDQSYSMVQIFLKRLPLGGAFFWSPGGIQGRDLDLDMGAFRKELNFRFYYFRCSFHDADISLEKLSDLGWKKPTFFINSNLSMALSLIPPEQDLLAGLSSNWRHNLKRFEKKKVSVEQWLNPDAQTLFEYYQKFESMKKLGQQHSLQSIQGAIEKFGDKLIIFRAFDSEGTLLGLRGYIQSGYRALDWYAISTEAGRSCYASYGVFWKILCDAKSRGVTHYDLSGVDPVGNAGVYNFKKGTGAHEVRYPGEFEKASFGLISYGMNKLIQRRLGTA